MEMFKGWWDTISKDPVWLWTVLGSCYLFATLIVRSFFFRSLVKRAKTLNSKYYHLIKKTYLQRSLPGWLFYFISFGLAALFSKRTFQSNDIAPRPYSGRNSCRLCDLCYSTPGRIRYCGDHRLQAVRKHPDDLVAMLARRIIPCLDINQGRVVKGIKFVSLKDAGDPVSCAQAYDKQRADELVFLDITASHEGRRTMIEVAEKVAATIYIPFTVGGGINTIHDIRDLLKAGCDKVSINTAAVREPKFISKASNRFGRQCIVVAIDAKRESKNQWGVYTHGGRTPARLDAIRWAKKAEKLGAGEILLTSMDCDGTKNGYDLELTRRISESVRIPVIASGGVGNLQHFYDGFAIGKADACLAASIFHFGEFSIPETKAFLAAKGILVRP